MQAFIPTAASAGSLFGRALLARSPCADDAWRPARTPPAAAPPGLRRGAAVVMHGPPQPAHPHGHSATSTTTTAAAGEDARRPGSHKGFVEEMRFVAMRLHTKDQAPREGTMEESALPIDAWLPSHADFMQFLADSLCVYTYFEQELTAGEHPNAMFGRFANTGLERVDAIKADMAYLNGLGVPTAQPTAAATRYVEYMKNLEKERPESVLCHWYNYYFAHSAGGRMIGRMMQDKLFDGRKFAFYEWDADVKQLLAPVRESIDAVASEWSRDVKDDCIKETGLAFGYSGTILENLAKAPAP
jgi:heme oxygenase (biliverdin-producing, ferredoxin)